MRHVQPPPGLSHEEWWLSTKGAREAFARPLPFAMSDGRPFTFLLPDPALEMTYYVERHASGQISVGEAVTNADTRDRYLVSSLIEEAIRSSQLEGAATTRTVAKAMLRTGRAPKDVGERMILANYRAMQFIREHVGEDLSSEFLLELHRVVGEGSVDPADLGRLQRPGEERVNVYWSDGQVVHRPPRAEELPARLDAMILFANGTGGGGFVPPVVRSILLHFWLAYDHPFADGNGRTARALFYWSMLRHGYWLTEYLSISRVLKQAPARYAKSFLYVETDAGDTTYFVLSQLRVLCRAIDDLRIYLERKVAEVRELEKHIRRDLGVNHRQRALLAHALVHPDFRYTYRSHAGSHAVTHEAARHDLQELVRLGLLEQQGEGNRHVFFPAVGLEARLKALAAL